MTPEIQAALNGLIVAFLGFLTAALIVAGVSLRGWAAERKKRKYVEGERDDALEQVDVTIKQADADRERLLNDFTKDCLRRVQDLERDLHDLRKDYGEQHRLHEQDRTRWLNERTAQANDMSAMRQKVETLTDENSELETIVAGQTSTIESLQKRSDRQETRIADLERTNADLLQGKGATSDGTV